MNLSGAVLTRIDFSKCDLSGACFTGAELTECNLSGANLEGTVFNRASLKKTRISLTDTGLMDWDQDAFAGIVADFGPLNAEFVFIPPGSFIMGSSKREQDRFDEEVPHFVKLTRGFFIQSTPVTQIQWQSVMGGQSFTLQELRAGLSGGDCLLGRCPGIYPAHEPECSWGWLPVAHGSRMGVCLSRRLQKPIPFWR